MTDAACADERSGDRPPAGVGSIAADSVSTVLARGATYAAAFVASVLVSRVLGPTGRGEYYLPVLTATTVVTVCTLGIEQANVVLLGNRAARIEQVWRQAGTIAFVAGLAGLFATVGTRTVFPEIYRDTPLFSLWLAGASIPFLLHTQFSAGLLTLRGLVIWPFKATIAATALQVALLVAAVLAHSLTVTAVLLINLVAAAAAWVLTIRPLRQFGGLSLRLDGALLRSTLAQAVPLHAATVILFLHLRADMFMVEAFVGTTALGLYSLAVTLAETVSLVGDSLSLAILPRQVGNTIAEAAGLALKGARTNAVLGSVFAIGWLVAGGILIPMVFGRAYRPAYTSLIVLLPGIVLLGMQRVCGGAVLRSNRPWRIASIQAASLALNIVLNLWTIPRFGAPGAALASSASYSLGAVIFLTWTARLAGTDVLASSVPRRSDVAAIWWRAQEVVRGATGALSGWPVK